MPRKGPAPKRPLDVDPVYGSPVVTQLVSKVLKDGKKQTAQRIVYGALEGTREKTGTDPVITLKRALDNVKPSIEVKSRRVGGATYQVPIEVKPGRSTTLGKFFWFGESGQCCVSRQKPLRKSYGRPCLPVCFSYATLSCCPWSVLCCHIACSYSEQGPRPGS